jgi:hypothetical protein
MPNLELNEDYQNLQDLKKKHKGSLFPLPNVVGVGIGRKLVNGEYTDDLSVRIYVSEKKPLDDLDVDERIPPHLEGTPTDVIEAGAPKPFAVYDERERPAQGGCSIGGGLRTGTMALVCRDTTDNTLVVLSNCHVIAEADHEGLGLASVGDAVYQPGASDMQLPMLPDVQIAELKRWKPFVLPPQTNSIDAAIAEVLDNSTVLRIIHEVGEPQGYRAVTPDDEGVTTVCKVGRTTGYTEGTIFDIAVDTNTDYGQGPIDFEDQLLIEAIDPPFMSGGDSGAAVLDLNGQLVGLADQWTGQAGENDCRSLVFDGAHLYAGLGTNPAQVVKIDRSDMTTVSTWTGSEGEKDLRAMMFDCLFSYLGLHTAPAKVIRLIMRDSYQVLPEIPVVEPLYTIPVLVVRYFPVDDGNIDIEVTGDVGEPLADVRRHTVTTQESLMWALSSGSTYHGYKQPAAQPSLGYQIVDTLEFLEPLPTYDHPDWDLPLTDYYAIMEQVNIEEWVEDEGVKEVWLWGYHGGVIRIFESNMAGPYGDISNSPQYPDDLPVLSKTYTVFHFDYARELPRAMEDYLHQVEYLLRATNWDLFWNNFVGAPPPWRCGNVHFPPNGEYDYDWANHNSVWTDIEDWDPDGLGPQQFINCARWNCNDRGWFIYWMQNIPGIDNGITCQGFPLTNWWMFVGDFDNAMANGLGLIEV